MHKLDQPQTTNTSKVRDAAAQIDAEEPTKSDLIIRGLRIERKRKNPNYSDSYCLGYLAAIVEDLTCADKTAREGAKSLVRALVKLGKGE